MAILWSNFRCLWMLLNSHTDWRRAGRDRRYQSPPPQSLWYFIDGSVIYGIDSVFILKANAINHPQKSVVWSVQETLCRCHCCTRRREEEEAIFPKWQNIPSIHGLIGAPSLLQLADQVGQQRSRRGLRREMAWQTETGKGGGGGGGYLTISESICSVTTGGHHNKRILLEWSTRGCRFIEGWKANKLIRFFFTHSPSPSPSQSPPRVLEYLAINGCHNILLFAMH